MHYNEGCVISLFTHPAGLTACLTEVAFHPRFWFHDSATYYSTFVLNTQLHYNYLDAQPIAVLRVHRETGIHLRIQASRLPGGLSRSIRDPAVSSDNQFGIEMRPGLNRADAGYVGQFSVSYLFVG